MTGGNGVVTGTGEPGGASDTDTDDWDSIGSEEPAVGVASAYSS